MKAIYQNELFYVQETFADTVLLEHSSYRVEVLLSDPELIIDPTDAEIDAIGGDDEVFFSVYGDEGFAPV